MKDQILKIAGVKSEKEFYKKFPTEESFMAKHGKKLEKLAMGKSMVNKQLKQLTDFGNPPIAQDGENIPQALGGGIFDKLVGGVKQFTESQGGLTNMLGNALGAGSTQGGGFNLAKGVTGLVGGKDATATAEAAGKAGGLSKAGKAGELIQAGMDIFQGVGKMKEQKNAINQANKDAQIKGLTATAAESKQVGVQKHNFARPEDALVQPDQLGSSQGTGSEILSMKRGGEIQNTYAPYTLYDDLGEIPTAEFGDYFQDSGQAQIGKGIGKAIGNLIPIPGLGKVTGEVFGTIGGTIGNIFGGTADANKLARYKSEAEKNANRILSANMADSIHSQLGAYAKDGGWVSHDWQPQVITQFGEHKVSDLLKADPTMDTLRAGGHLKEYTPPSARAMYTGRDLPYQMEDGGYMAMGGALKTHWGGEAEHMSYNPYIPGGGETVMFRGQSHDETNGKGQSGIGITYGDNPVEVERGEPMTEMADGGVVFGNMKINKLAASEIGDPKAKGKKFKNYVADLSKTETKQNKILDKASQLALDASENTPFGRLALNSSQASIIGANMKLKDIAQKKQDAAAVQNAILDTADEFGLVSDELAQGKIKKAKFGGKFTAQFGKTIEQIKARKKAEAEARANMTANNFIQGPLTPQQRQMSEFSRPGDKLFEGSRTYFPERGQLPLFARMLGAKPKPNYFNPELTNTLMNADDRSYLVTKPSNPELSNNLLYGTRNYPTYNPDFTNAMMYGTQYVPPVPVQAAAAAATTPSASPEVVTVSSNNAAPTQAKPKGGGSSKTSAKGSSKGSGKGSVKQSTKTNPTYVPKNLNTSNITGIDAFGNYTGPDEPFANEPVANQQFSMPSNMATSNITGVDIFGNYTGPKQPFGEEGKDKSKLNWNLIAQTALSRLDPYLRPTNQMPLDPNQLMGEYYALGNNQLEPVQAQTFQPQLGGVMDVSYQDQLNEITAQARAAERMMQNNPEAAANLFAQASQAKNKVLAEQTRANMAGRKQVYDENRNLLNQAQLQNLGIYDKQYERQSQAKSATKAQAITALNSISDKIAKNKAENMKLGILENMYGFRFDKQGRAISYNTPPQFNLSGTGTGGSTYGGMNLKPIDYDDDGNPTKFKAIGKKGSSKPSVDEINSVLGGGKNGKKIKPLNGSIVKALKRI